MKNIRLTKKRTIPYRYAPKGLTKSDRKKQLKSIKLGINRPKIKSYKSKRSSWTVQFQKKYGTKISDYNFINKNLLSKTGINLILNKGRAAYYTSGSRPNQTAESWARARLASVLMYGPAFKVDKNIAEKYGKNKWLKNKPKMLTKKKI